MDSKAQQTWAACDRYACSPRRFGVFPDENGTFNKLYEKRDVTDILDILSIEDLVNAVPFRLDLVVSGL